MEHLEEKWYHKETVFLYLYIFVKKIKQLTLLKMCVTSLLCSPWADLWPFCWCLCKRFCLYV